jgi:hypothetical protein
VCFLSNILNENILGKGYPRYFTIVDGGNREGLTFFWSIKPKWSAFRKAAYGYGRLDMFNMTHLRFSWMSGEVLAQSVKAQSVVEKLILLFLK